MSNSGSKESMAAKVMDTKLKYKVNGISSSTTSANKNINSFKTSVASAKKAADTAIIKLVYLAKK